jgi:hypothetical protein
MKLWTSFYFCWKNFIFWCMIIFWLWMNWKKKVFQFQLKHISFVLYKTRGTYLIGKHWKKSPILAFRLVMTQMKTIIYIYGRIFSAAINTVQYWMWQYLFNLFAMVECAMIGLILPHWWHHDILQNNTQHNNNLFSLP